MSDKGDKICPLCTEEMDLTDQQLKPCKCGYEICVWCWNHIMEMAEKDNTEGRCPACRTPYDKEKIVGMAADCERLVAELNSERKLKSQKMKPKTSEGRMHLSNVRVIQRNLVYIIGLPLNLADETLLQRREYFGQYGKVLKVSISRTATGAIQHSANNSCCVYITYTKEEEAVRCIQSVHSYVLEGRSLRACFGTTKYCHTWLKNMPCTIPDCLYLHDFGSPEDSFTKDDLVSAFTRSRVQQIIGATNNLHRQSGNFLPPPADDQTNRNVTIAKSNSENSSSNMGYSDSGSLAETGIQRSNSLPGASSWVMRVSGSLPHAASLSGSGGTLNENPETSNAPRAFSSEVLGDKKYIEMKKPILPEGSSKLHQAFLRSSDHLAHLPVSASQDILGDIATPVAGASSLKLSKPSHAPDVHEDELYHSDGDIQGLCSGLSSIGFDDNFMDPIQASSISNHNLLQVQGSQQDERELSSEPSTSPASGKSTVEDLLGFSGQQLQCFGDTHHQSSFSYAPCSELNSEESIYHSWQPEVNPQSKSDSFPDVAATSGVEDAFPSTSSSPLLSNEFYDHHANGFAKLDGSSNYYNLPLDVGSGKYIRESDSNLVNVHSKVDQDAGESSIISNILSMDFEAWEDLSLTSLQGVVKSMAESDKQHNSLRIPSSRKPHENNQSRFSFAREDDLLNQASSVECFYENENNKPSASNYFIENKDMHMDKYHDVSSNLGSVKSNGYLGSHPFMPSRISVSKSPISPPGFSVSSRAVPPGFPTHGTVQHAFNQSANHLLQNTVLSSRTVGSLRDAEFIDPAIVEATKGNFARRQNNPHFDTRPAFPSELSPLDHDIELQMLMQQSISSQNPRYPDHFRNMFSSPNDAYDISPRLHHSPPNNHSLLAEMTSQQLGNMRMQNGHWGGWNEMKSNNLGASDLLLNGQIGFDKFVPSYNDMKYQMSSNSNNLYSRGFAM